ncbi:hypothetical protein [Chromobacterium subtsugae]|uniref:hypothetical protein n=1 Tax=Chromobacterium subtsugae TaxID=251747 RepID=UPI0006418553|nr:hypothetical protein [Chromobacterium subtsugae]
MASFSPTTSGVSVPAPVGGWNARDAIANMPANMACILINMFPTPSDVEIRPGFQNWATGLPGQVDSVFAYNGLAARLFAASSAGIYDVTNSGAVGAPAVAGQSSDRYVTAHMTTPGGTFLYAVNGLDYPQLYNGSSWQQVTATSSPISITGIPLNQISFVHTAKSRIWFVIGGTQAAYLPVQSLGGAAQIFDVGPVFRNGGRLVAIGSWSATGGFGAQDLTVFVSSTGEVAIYQGTDPSQLTTWALVGVWQFGSPMGNRCLTRFGDDLLYLSKDGLTSFMQGRFFADVSDNKSALTDNIQWAISNATGSYPNNYGWQTIAYPTANALIVNVPVSQGQQQQYVQNTVTGAWCQFQGWNANAFEVFHDQLYFGGAGIVAQAWKGWSDNGAAIQAEALPAFSNFGQPATLKNWTSAKPIFSSSGQPSFLMMLNIDYDTTPPIGMMSTAPITMAMWGSAIWGTSTWPYGQTIINNWQSVTGMGYTAALHLKITTNGANVKWMATDFAFEIGSVM